MTSSSEQLGVRSTISTATEIETSRNESLRPLRSVDVRLLGAMNGVGFTESQWLIQRKGEYIQVTDLLYRIVELADGSRSLRDIADEVTASTRWIVEPDEIEHLIDSKLVPLGIIGESGQENTSPSPLDLNLRCKTISPRFINPLTRFAKYLCSPAVVSVVLAACAAGHWWLYRYHGIARGFQDAVYTPGALAGVIGLIFLGAAFHELGHASALRYHGGNVDGMGVGLYLIYPVFYTDVTDGYRLSRWARLATDLGGIYFHLIFVLVLFGAYFKTHHELFLFSVLLVDLEIVRQFIPVIRLDGYWALCDLTGVPDLFSQTLPFLQSLSPALNLKNSALPQLKKWVAVVYAIYLVVTIPLLGYLFLMMILKFPDVLLTTRAALHTQVTTLLSPGVLHSPSAAFLVSLQIVLLLVPVAGTVYLVWVMLKGPLWNFINWTARTPRNTAIGLTSALAVCSIAVIIVVLPPQTLFRRALKSEPTSVIVNNRNALASASSLRADIEGTLGKDYFSGTVVLKRPNFARIEVNATGELGHFSVISDGGKITTYFKDDNEYVEAKPGSHGEQINAFVADQVSDFFQPELLSHRPNLRTLGSVTDHGEEYEVVTYRSPTQFVRYFISKKDNLVHRVVRGQDANHPTASASMSDIQVNGTIESVAFERKLPSTAKPAQMPANFVLPVQ